MPIGRLHHWVIDAPDPRAMAAFYQKLLGCERTHDEDDWVVIAPSGQHSGIAFQLAPDVEAPTWPRQGVAQQIHADVMVDDLAEAHDAVIALGARPLHREGSDHVYADPAGHPFCLIRRPAWAAPVNDPASPRGQRSGPPA